MAPHSFRIHPLLAEHCLGLVAFNTTGGMLVLKGDMLPNYVITIAVFGFSLAIAGFCMTFRQNAIRRVFNRPLKPTQFSEDGNREDAMTYILRIAGVMIMVFGIAIAGMFIFMSQNS